MLKALMTHRVRAVELAASVAAMCIAGLMAIGCDSKTETPSGNPAPTPQASEAAAPTESFASMVAAASRVR